MNNMGMNGMNNMNNGMQNGMNNMNGMMNNNNGLYVPKTEGTSIADIIQNKKQGESGAPSPSNGNIAAIQGQGYGYHQGHGGPSYPQDNRYGYGVDSNGYPVPAQRNSRPNPRAGSPGRPGPSGPPGGSRPDPRQRNADPHSDTNSEYERIMDLANDVTNSLEALDENENRRTGRRDSESDSESNDSVHSSGSAGSRGNGHNVSDKDSEEADENNESDIEEVDADPISDMMQDGYGMMIIEPILLLTIYVILSQPFAINFTSHYIDQLNPGEDGAIPLSGIIIYGIILVIMFMVLRKLIEYKLQN
jgi:hypothetical protein